MYRIGATMPINRHLLVEILDPNGNLICMVYGQYAAEALLTHLNRS